MTAITIRRDVHSRVEIADEALIIDVDVNVSVRIRASLATLLPTAVRC
jgi:hypothetical protein